MVIEAVIEDTLVVTISLESTGNVTEDEQSIEDARIDIANVTGSDEANVIVASIKYVNEDGGSSEESNEDDDGEELSNEDDDDGEESNEDGGSSDESNGQVLYVMNVQYFIYEVDCGDEIFTTTFTSSNFSNPNLNGAPIVTCNYASG